MKKLVLTLILAGMSAAAVEVKDLVGNYSVGSCTVFTQPKRAAIKAEKLIDAKGLVLHLWGDDASQIEILMDKGIRKAPGSTNPTATQAWNSSFSAAGFTSVEVLKSASQGVNETTTKSLKFVRNILVYSEVTIGSSGRVISQEKCELYKK